MRNILLLYLIVYKEKKDLTLQVLRKFKKVFAYRISDISGIDPSFYSHKIVVVKEFKPCVVKRILIMKNIKLIFIPRSH